MAADPFILLRLIRVIFCMQLALSIGSFIYTIVLAFIGVDKTPQDDVLSTLDIIASKTHTTLNTVASSVQSDATITPRRVNWAANLRSPHLRPSASAIRTLEFGRFACGSGVRGSTASSGDIDISWLIVDGVHYQKPLVELSRNSFRFPSRYANHVSRTVVLKNVNDFPVVYKISAHPPHGITMPERDQYISTFRVRHSPGVLRGKEEVRLRVIYSPSFPPVKLEDEARYAFTLRAAPLEPGEVPEGAFDRMRVEEFLRRSDFVQGIDLEVELPAVY